MQQQHPSLSWQGLGHIESDRDTHQVALATQQAGRGAELLHSHAKPSGMANMSHGTQSIFGCVPCAKGVFPAPSRRPAATKLHPPPLPIQPLCNHIRCVLGGGVAVVEDQHSTFAALKHCGQSTPDPGGEGAEKPGSQGNSQPQPSWAPPPHPHWGKQGGGLPLWPKSSQPPTKPIPFAGGRHSSVPELCSTHPWGREADDKTW
jgi:hypothetical protein